MALLLVHDLAGIVGIFEDNGGFDAAVQLYGDLLPKLTGALEVLRF